jgi:polyisoprenoid-binding protein YceI
MSMHKLSLAMAVCALVAETGMAQFPPGRVKAAELWFDAKASLGAFRGTTKAAQGQMTGGANLASVRGFVEMQAASLSTDNGIRDKDMRKTLEVEKFPVIRFDLDSVGVRSESPDSARIDLIGRMTIHGVTRPLRIPANMRRQGNELRVTGGCDLFLPAYGVTKLKRMLGMLSMEETIHMGIDVTFNLEQRTDNK